MALHCNFELIAPSAGDSLTHWRRDNSSSWKAGPIFGPADATGAVGFVESSWGPGNFEVVVGVGGSQLQHWWRRWSIGGETTKIPTGCGRNLRRSARELREFWHWWRAVLGSISKWSRSAG